MPPWRGGGVLPPRLRSPGPARWVLAPGTATAGGIASTARLSPRVLPASSRRLCTSRPPPQHQPASSGAFEIGPPRGHCEQLWRLFGNPPGRQWGRRGRVGPGGARAGVGGTPHPERLKVGLRQLDMSLLCQLYSLHESIQEYKGACQAAASAEGSYALENGFFEEEEEDFQEQNPPRGGRERGPPRDLSLPTSALSSGDWILESI
ncbi:protein FAM89A isoform X1 [Artibeus jamaicensis]|uniref:protein FAM89A isoform X1 n=1 Tax=Artibeus jamaicensis TaxID=9417 RepID=UPI00235AF5D4|nr:protein FAM89A isoform X1 [Artibeus jamaicensis]